MAYIIASMISQPTLTISSTMRIAAQSVATAHAHYVAHCGVMHTLKGKPQAMAAALKNRKDAHVAYHVALAFLKTSTLQANPQLDLVKNKSVHWRDRPALQTRVYVWADSELGQLIGDGASHAVLAEAKEVVWG